jgi:hypothetical protein
MRIVDDHQVAAAACGRAGLADGEILAAPLGVPPACCAGVRAELQVWKDGAVFGRADEVAQFAPEVLRERSGVRAFQDLVVRVLAQVLRGEQHAGEFAFAMARRQVHDASRHLSPVDALEHVSHDFVVGSVDELRPDSSDKSQEVAARLVRIAAVEQALDSGASGGRKLAELANEVSQVVVGRVGDRAHG